MKTQVAPLGGTGRDQVTTEKGYHSQSCVPRAQELWNVWSLKQIKFMILPIFLNSAMTYQVIVAALWRTKCKITV